MTTSKLKTELILKLKDKEYRDAFVVSHINNVIPFQIRTLREQREFSQEELARLTGKQQEAVSRLENPNYERYTLATLKELASAFDVGLVVRFVPISKLVEWELNLDSESLKVLSFKDEAYFQEQDEIITSDIVQYTIPYQQEALGKVIDLNEYRLKTKSITDKNINIVSTAACM